MPFLLALLLLAPLVAAAMSVGAMVCDKTRVLVNAQVINGTVVTPTDFTTTTLANGDKRVSHAGDLQGAFIGAIEIGVTTFSGTSITPVFETSEDGVAWVTWATGFVALTAAGTTTKYAEDDFESPKRFIRISWTNAGAGTGTVTVKIRYAQVGGRGSYAPPGLLDRH